MATVMSSRQPRRPARFTSPSRACPSLSCRSIGVSGNPLGGRLPCRAGVIVGPRYPWADAWKPALPGGPEVILGLESNQLFALGSKGVPYGLEDGERNDEDGEGHADSGRDEPWPEPFCLIHQVDPCTATREGLEEPQADADTCDPWPCRPNQRDDEGHSS